MQQMVPLQNQLQNQLPQNQAQFNQRLVQEIQQNHPMLSFNRTNNNNQQRNHMNGNHQHQQRYNMVRDFTAKEMKEFCVINILLISEIGRI